MNFQRFLNRKWQGFFVLILFSFKGHKLIVTTTVGPATGIGLLPKTQTVAIWLVALGSLGSAEACGI